jgi:GTPase KRas protein
VTRTVDGVPYHLMLTDTAGQEEYRGLWAASNLQSDAFLLVYDITSPNSLDALDFFMEMIDMEEENRIDNGKTPPVKIVAGNKCDLQGQRQIKAKDGLEWARRRKCGFMETSAREMVNIEETFARESARRGRMRRHHANCSSAGPPSSGSPTTGRRRYALYASISHRGPATAQGERVVHRRTQREKRRHPERELLEQAQVLVATRALL